MNWLVLAILGLFAGSLSSMLGIGGGIIIVPVLVWLGIPMNQAVGTSLAVILPTSLSGTISHATKGDILWYHAVIISATAVIGAYFGAQATSVIPAPLLKRLFAALMVLMAVKMSIS